MSNPFIENWHDLRERRGLSNVQAMKVILLIGGQRLAREDLIDLERLSLAGRLTLEEAEALRLYREGENGPFNQGSIRHRSHNPAAN